MRTFNQIRLILIVLFIFVFFLPPVVTSASWYDNFNARKTITIRNTNTNALSNYQVQILLHAGTGSDTNSHIYLNNNVLSDFKDIRFTQADGVTLLDYWIESIDSGTATIWVEVNSLAASGDTQIYVYYNSPSANSQSNAQAVFPFAETFDENGIDDWTGSVEDLDHADETGQQSQQVSTTRYVSSPNSAQLRTYASCLSGPFNGVKSLITANPSLPSGNYTVNFSLRNQITGFRYSTSAAQRSRVRINGTEKFYKEITCNGLNCTTESSWSNESFNLTSTAINSIALVGDSYDCTNGNTYYDNVYVRQYVADTPTITTTGTAEVRVAAQNTAPPVFMSSGEPHCNISAPAGIPDLFQINTTTTTATLYFTPLMDTNQYFVSFSTNLNAEEHGALLTLGSEGVQQYTVDYLSPATQYFFKVRGHKSCMPGSWSEIKPVTTKGMQTNVSRPIPKTKR